MPLWKVCWGGEAAGESRSNGLAVSATVDDVSSDENVSHQGCWSGEWSIYNWLCNEESVSFEEIIDFGLKILEAGAVEVDSIKRLVLMNSHPLSVL